MKKVAVFGGPGAGKSTLSKKLAALTQLPLLWRGRRRRAGRGLCEAA